MEFYLKISWIFSHLIIKGNGDCQAIKMPAVTGRKGDVNKARAVSRNGVSGGSMRQNPCAQRTANQLYGSGEEVEQACVREA